MAFPDNVVVGGEHPAKAPSSIRGGGGAKKKLAGAKGGGGGRAKNKVDKKADAPKKQHGHRGDKQAKAESSQKRQHRGDKSTSGKKSGLSFGAALRRAAFGDRESKAMEGRAFNDIPLFMIDEDVSRLMRHAPPYGYKFGQGKRAFRLDELHAKRRNATKPLQTSGFRSCAVVGSSGTLLHQRLGKEIDRHDAVIRVNGAPLGEQYKPFAGSKTTWRLFSSPHASSDYSFHEERQYPNQTMLVLCDRPYVYSCQNVMFAKRKPNLHNVNPRFYEAVRKLTDKRKNAIPLTGVVAVALAIRACDTVNVYGMSTMQSLKPSTPAAMTNQRRVTTCFYYFRCQQSDAVYHSRPGDAEFHDFSGNAKALLRWNASGAITIRV